MPFFSDIGKKLTQTGQDAVKGTKNLADIARLNSTISEEQKLLNSYYLQIGQKYYDIYTQNAEEPFAEFCKSISESIKKINDCKDEIQFIKGIKKCANCGSEIPHSTAFCGFCGFDTTKPAENDSSAERKCPSCGRVLPENVFFCTDCGQKL